MAFAIDKAVAKLLEAAFPVRKTGQRKNHYTIEFQEPVSDAEADRFNIIIGREPPAPFRPLRIGEDFNQL